MNYKECRISQLSEGRTLCAEDKACLAVPKLQGDLDLNPSLTAEAQMNRASALGFAAGCRELGCVAFSQLEEIAKQFPETVEK
jgi:hypothetical protein